METFNFIDLKTQEEFENIIKENGSCIFNLAVPRVMIESGDYQYINNILDILSNSKLTKGSVFIMSFDGYDNDSREIYTIPEIITFIDTIIKYKPDAIAKFCKETLEIIFLAKSLRLSINKGSVVRAYIDNQLFLDCIKQIARGINDIEELEEFYYKYNNILLKLKRQNG